MTYRSLNTLTRCLERNLAQVRDADLIVGIPRSGLLVANLLSLMLHKPLAELDGFLRGERIAGGKRLGCGEEAAQRVVVIDDSALTGREIERARAKVAAAGRMAGVRFGCVYADPAALELLDFHFELLPGPRVFEWNLLHHWVLSRSCVDLDGFLCRDPTPEENDDGPNYQLFLDRAEPFMLPCKPIAAVVTCRLEKYRPATERWLARHGIEYGRLVMMPCLSKAERQARGHAAFKADAYRAGDHLLFIESSPAQAAEIFHRTGRPVFCSSTKTMLSR